MSGASFKSYKTEEEAWNAYRILMIEQVVRVVRDPGDEVVFGPAEQAMQPVRE